MTIQLFSIEHAPASLPVWHTILADLGDPPVHRVARVLGLGRRTIYRYNATGCAPKSTLLALFWLTRWGRSLVNAQAINDAVLAVQLVQSLRDENLRLSGEVEHMRRLASYGSANEPLQGVTHAVR